MSIYSITNPSEQALRVLITAGGGEETLLLQREGQELRAQVALEPSGSKLVASLRIGDRTETSVLQADDPANANHIADYLEALANGTAETAKQPCAAHPVPLRPCLHCAGEAIAVDYMADDRWINRIYCRYNNCHEVDGYESATAARAAWNDLNTAPIAQGEPGAAVDMVNHPPHYNGHPSGVECIEVTERLPFNLGNAFKYVFRHRAKNGRQDLEKARWYLARELERQQRSGIGIGHLQTAHALSSRIAAHEPYPVGAALVAIAADEPAAALQWVEHLLAA